MMCPFLYSGPEKDRDKATAIGSSKVGQEILLLSTLAVSCDNTQFLTGGLRQPKGYWIAFANPKWCNSLAQGLVLSAGCLHRLADL